MGTEGAPTPRLLSPDATVAFRASFVVGCLLGQPHSERVRKSLGGIVSPGVRR